MLSLWQGSWIAALFVGCLVWGLIIWCIVAYRQRGSGTPPQLAFNLPIEILYTIVPVIFVAVLFYFTARDETAIDKLSPNPDVTVEVVGFQWDWQFNYLSSADDQTASTVAEITGDNAHGSPAMLELPAGKSVRFKLVSPDVIHAITSATGVSGPGGVVGDADVDVDVDFDGGLGSGVNLVGWD